MTGWGARRGVALTSAMGLALGLVVAGCSSGSVNPTSTTSPSSTSSSTGASTAEPTGSPTPSSVPTLANARTTPVVHVPTSSKLSLLTSTRLASQPGYDRFVLQFNGPIPGFTVRYVDRPVRADPSNQIVSLAGSAALQITLRPAATTDLAAATTAPSYAGSRRITGDTNAVQEAVLTGDFENVMTWVLGVDVRRPFVVRTLRSPSRVAVDVAATTP
jgi:hypothetical protein